jgi:hypothetical protein
MNKKIVIQFDNKIEEQLLIELINTILKDLSYKKLFFFLDDDLVDNYCYYFVFSGNIKKYSSLIKNIKNFIQIKNFLLTT